MARFSIRFGPGRWYALLACSALLTGGCHTTDDCGGTKHCCAHDPATVPPPLGHYLGEFKAIQAGLAEEDDFVLYEYEWVGDTARPGPYGGRHLEQIAVRLAAGEPPPVVIEVHPEPNVNEARQQFVIGFLAERGVPNAHERVFVGYPKAEGMYGEEAVSLYPRYITTSSQAGFNRGAGMGGFGGGRGFNRFGGAGLGGFGIGGLGAMGGMGGIGGVGGLGGFSGYGFGY